MLPHLLGQREVLLRVDDTDQGGSDGGKFSFGIRRRNESHNSDFSCFFFGELGHDERMADARSSKRCKQCRCFLFGITHTTDDLLGELLNDRVHEKPGITALHVAYDPVLALLVADIGPPCWK